MAAPAASLPTRHSYESELGPADDQGGTTQCVAYAIAGLKRYHEWREGRQWRTFDPAALYARCKELDGMPSAPGTLPRVAMDVLRQEGMLADDGRKYAIAAAARQTNLAGVKQAIVEQGPVVLGVLVDVAQFAQMSDCSIARLNERSAGFSGHCMLAVGYDDTLGALLIRNSWGDRWNDCGHLWLDYAYLETVDAQFDAWSTVDALGTAA